MENAEILQVARDALYVLLIIASPVMIVATIVGLSIALFQALTQIQEATLTFVPKILAMILTLIIVLPFMFNTLVEFSTQLYDKIVHIQ